MKDRPDYFVPDGDVLLDVKGLADQLLRTPTYVYAMTRDGFIMPGGRATLNQALRWLVEHPDFRQNTPLPR